MTDDNLRARSSAPEAREEAQPVAWTEDIERERREADYERGFRHGKESAFNDAGSEPVALRTEVLRAVFDWIREDAPVSLQMQMLPEITAKLVDRLSAKPLYTHPAAPSADKLRIALEEAVEPFAAFARVAEAKSRMALGKVLPDNEVIASISWEGGLGVLVMGHLRDALSMAPDAKGWGGLYRRSESLAALKAEG